MLFLHCVVLMYYGNLIVFSAFDEARERGCEYQRVNGMTDFKKAT
jgi:hypothetical protein